MNTPFTEALAGRRWQVVADPRPGRAGAVLNSVSCPAAGFCVAVGRYFNDRTLTEVFDGHRWAVVPSPNGPVGGADDGNELTSVSCPSARFCMAAGDYLHAAKDHTLTEVFDGHHWAVVPSPSPGKKTSMLQGVSCPVPRWCMAVGYDDSWHILAERYDGSRWSVLSAPSPGQSSGELAGIFCPTMRSCMAVGDDWQGQGNQTLAESFNRGHWEVLSSPDAPESNYLTGIWCSAGNRCLAAGHYAVAHGGSGVITESFDGQSWSAVTSPATVP